MENVFSEEHKKRLLNGLPVRVLTQVAKENELPSQGKKEQLVDLLSMALSKEVILELYSEFAYAGNVTCHIFKTSILKGFRRQDLIEKLAEKGLIKTLEDILPPETIKYSSQPKLAHSIWKNPRGLFLFEFLGIPIPILSPDTRTREWITPLRQVACSYRPDSGLLDVRSRSSEAANVVAKVFCEIFNLKRPKRIIFSDTELQEIIKRAKTLRNVRFKPHAGILSSLSLTARHGEDLRGEQTFENWKVQATLTGLYLWIELTNGKRVGLQINIREGKIFFKTHIGETEIDEIFETLQVLLGLSS